MAGAQTRHVISKWNKLREGKKMVQVVYKEHVGTKNGKPMYNSITKHELQ